MLLKRPRMRAVHHHQPFSRLRVMQGKRPSYAATPIMSNDDRLFFPEGANQSHDISSNRVHSIIGDAHRLATVVIPTEVRSDHAKMLGQHRDLMSPGIPKLREAVKQNDERPLPLRHIV